MDVHFFPRADIGTARTLNYKKCLVNSGRFNLQCLYCSAEAPLGLNYGGSCYPKSFKLIFCFILIKRDGTMNKRLGLATAVLVMVTASASAVNALADIVVPMNLVNEKGIGASAGQVTISESKYGLIFTPSLQGLAPGVHGFHVHQNPSCEPIEKDGKIIAAGAAGGHYDPESKNTHGAPWGEGHLGDLPPLYVEASGSANQAVLAPRLKLSDLPGRAIMIHAGGDNHADHPAALGGGGARVSCGIIK